MEFEHGRYSCSGNRLEDKHDKYIESVSHLFEDYIYMSGF